MDGLLVDGLPREKWEEANGLFLEACALRRNRDYLGAAEKLAEARKINAVNEGFKAAEAEIAEILASRTAFQNALNAANEAERLAREAVANAVAAGATAEERAEAERKAREAAEAKRCAEEAANAFDTGAAQETALKTQTKKKKHWLTRLVVAFFFTSILFIPGAGVAALLGKGLSQFGMEVSDEGVYNITLLSLFCVGFIFADHYLIELAACLGGVLFLITILG